jgi:CheY-like chemotaxis protein
MEAHGGSIGVYSAGEGLGSTFYIDVPILSVDINIIHNHEVKDNSPMDTQYLKLNHDNRSITTQESVTSHLLSMNQDVNTEYSASMDSSNIDSGSNKSNQSFKSTKSSWKATPGNDSSRDEFRYVSFRLRLGGLLVVDDSTINRKMVIRILGHNFSYVDQACDGREALLKFSSLEPGKVYDVVMMDSEMPVMKGSDIVLELRKRGYRGLIVGVTGNSHDEDKQSLYSAGCDKVMVKPLDVRAFLNFIKERAAV